MRTTAKITADQETFLIANGSSMTPLELSRAIDLGISKIHTELKRLGIEVFIKNRSKNNQEFRRHLPVGLMPNPERSWTRPVAIYSNKRYTYLEIEAIQ